MPAKRGRGASFRVEFDDARFTEDLAHCSPGARKAGAHARAEIDRNGQPVGKLLPCETESRDGINLPGCVKTRVPWPAGRWGMVFQLRIDKDRRPYLAFVAFGVRHHPKIAHALNVYEVASRRLAEIAARDLREDPA